RYKNILYTWFNTRKEEGSILVSDDCIGTGNRGILYGNPVFSYYLTGYVSYFWFQDSYAHISYVATQDNYIFSCFSVIAFTGYLGKICIRDDFMYNEIPIFVRYNRIVFVFSVKSYC